VSVLIAALLLATPSPPEPVGEPVELRELVPGVRVGERVVEFEGTVCADTSHPQTPVVYLELLVTGPDSREHESLVVTDATPSAIHAGLLAAGFEPGRPVRVENGSRIAPSGAELSVWVSVLVDGVPGAFVPLSDWAVRVREEGDESEAERLTDDPGWGLVFAGSLLKDGGYAADRTGTVVGLTGFGTEVVAAAWTLSPWIAQDAPVWIVDDERVAPFGSAVTVRITGADRAHAAPDEGGRPSVGDDPDTPRP